MNKTLLVISREYLERVRKRTFIVLTILGPFLYLLLIGGPAMLSMWADEERTVKVVDETGIFDGQFQNTGSIKFEYSSLNAEEAFKELSALSESGVFYLVIPGGDLHNPEPMTLAGSQSPGMQLENTIRSQINQHIEKLRLTDYGMSDTLIADIKKPITLHTKVEGESGLEDASTGIASATGFISGLLIYFFIFAYGGMVIQGVQEEKSSRIVEIIVSSVRPFQLMIGKIAGVALLGITQLILWAILTIVLLVVGGYLITMFYPGLFDIDPSIQASASMHSNPLLEQSFATLGQVNFPLLMASFVFFFICGYLLYAAMFAAIGAMVDNQNDTQQFMIPVSIPLFFGLISIFPIAENPNGSFAFWLSMIPFTSPISMMTRIPFGIPVWEIMLSAAILICSFILITWLASRIYHTGILLYGTKPTVRQVISWVFRG